TNKNRNRSKTRGSPTWSCRACPGHPDNRVLCPPRARQGYRMWAAAPYFSPLAGRSRNLRLVAQIPVRGSRHESEPISEPVATPPHPDPLPASGEREELCPRRDTLAVEHGRNRKQSLLAGTLALIVVEEFEASL